jgi:hypothetical protein
MTDSTDEPTIPARSQHSNLSAAIIACQNACWSMTRDKFNKSGGYGYASADNVSEYARKMLTAFGLCWTRTSCLVRGPSMLSCDIGGMSCVGEVAIGWSLRHESGEHIDGVSEYPVIAQRGRPHDKATQASITYGTGNILMGLLCLDREDKHTTVDGRDDARADDRPAPPPKPAASKPPAAKPAPAKPATPPDSGEAFCTGKAAGISKAIRDYATELARMRLGADASKSELAADIASVVHTAYGACDTPRLPDGGWPKPEQLRVSMGTRVKDWIAAELVAARAS